MNESPMHFTLRKAQAHFAERRTWLGLLVVGTLIGLVGPFGTFEYLPILPRLIYWLAICAGTYAAGFACATGLSDPLAERLRPEWLGIAIAGLLPGIPIAPVVFVANGLTFGFSQTGLIDLTTLLIYCPLISLGVTLASNLINNHLAARPQSTLPGPALLERLPHPLRGRLLHLAVADHYVEVTTDKGTFMVLMRLSDAIRETMPVRGLQVHRSHWVALDAVSRATRLSGKPVLELVTGATIPISRTFLENAKAAGLVV